MIISKIKRWFTFANCVIIIGLITAVVYIFSYLFPVTDNAFIVNNVRPVASLEKGFVTGIYIKNGEYVKKGQKLLTVFDKPYVYALEKESANVAAAEAKIDSLTATLARDIELSKSQKDVYIKLKQDDDKFHKAYQINAISLMALQNSEQETKAAFNTYSASIKQIDIDKKDINLQKNIVKTMEAQFKNAQVDLEQTIVYADNDGIIQNMFISLGTPVNVNQPLFSLVDTQTVFFQANFNETDLRKVHKGSRALIFPRIYLGQKMFHGIVDSDYWGANRQLTDARSQMQDVTNENQWVLLPQRLPVQIRVTDFDPKYPLRVGTSAYVYIETE